MINTHLAVLVLLNIDSCCDCCHSAKVDDVADAIASGDCYATTTGDIIDGLYATVQGMSLLRKMPLLPDATA
jgi:hypothetical protein